MNRLKKIMVAILALCVVLQAGSFRALAAEPYTYTVTFYAGDKGTFSGSGVQVSSSSGKAEVHTEGSKIMVTGLELGDRVGLAAAAGGTVALNDSGKYYVKGIRRSGYDNNTVSASSFEITGDADYVVAYGIRGEVAAYTVNYQDENGNALGESQTYYGNVGDKPVVAFLYVDGYVPEAYNLTKTLVSDESQNVFTFVYRPIPAPTATPGEEPNQNPTTPAPGNTGTNAGDNEGGAGDAENPDNAGGAGDANNPDNEGGAEDAENPDNAGGAGDAENPDNAGGQDLQEVPDQDVPQDLVDLDEEQTPLANVDASAGNQADGDGDGDGAGMSGGLVAGGSAALIIIGLIIFFIKKKKTLH